MEDRILSKININGDCWEFTGYVHKGYGQILVNRIPRPAHRILYEIRNGKIPSNLVCDHLCRNRKCVNPSHIELVSNWINTLRGKSIVAENAQKTHCPYGHEYSEANTIFRKRKYGIGRECRECIKRRYRTVKHNRTNFNK